MVLDVLNLKLVNYGMSYMLMLEIYSLLIVTRHSLVRAKGEVFVTRHSLV